MVKQNLLSYTLLLADTGCPLVNAIKGCIIKLLRKPFLKLILVAKFQCGYDILICGFEKKKKKNFRIN